MIEPVSSATPRRILIVRLTSMGDIVHAIPVAAALRDVLPSTHISWLVDERWRPLAGQIEGVDAVLSVPRNGWRKLREGIARLRAEQFDCVLDVQGLYKSSILAWLSGAELRVGFDGASARESGAALFYNRRVSPSHGHRIVKNLSLVAAIAPGDTSASFSARVRFPLRVPPTAEASVRQALRAHGVNEYFMLSPAGGWISKCWPADRFGALHQRLANRLGYRGIVTYGPGEKHLAEAVLIAAGTPAPLLLELDIPQMMAALRGAHFFVGGDTGPLHVAVALGTPVIGLYGPTDPKQTGPYCREDVVVRNARPDETTYERGSAHAPSMLSITVDQVEEAVNRRLAAVACRAEARQS